MRWMDVDLVSPVLSSCDPEGYKTLRPLGGYFAVMANGGVS